MKDFRSLLVSSGYVLEWKGVSRMFGATIQAKDTRERAARYDEIFKEAMEQPGVKEVLEVYNASREATEYFHTFLVPQDTAVLSESDGTSWGE